MCSYCSPTTLNKHRPSYSTRSRNTESTASPAAAMSMALRKYGAPYFCPSQVEYPSVGSNICIVGLTRKIQQFKLFILTIKVSSHHETEKSCHGASASKAMVKL